MVHCPGCILGWLDRRFFRCASCCHRVAGHGSLTVDTQRRKRIASGSESVPASFKANYSLRANPRNLWPASIHRRKGDSITICDAASQRFVWLGQRRNANNQFLHGLNGAGVLLDYFCSWDGTKYNFWRQIQDHLKFLWKMLPPIHLWFFKLNWLLGVKYLICVNTYCYQKS